MKVCGIICEYNPFHNGHLYHIQQARLITNCDCLVVVLTGNYVQRGDFSILNKWEKTKLALQFGCDLVVELPTIQTLQSAEYFAKYTTHLLRLLNVDTSVFGSESNNIQLLKNAITTIPNKRNNGNSWRKEYNIQTTIHTPNDILGVNYLRYLHKTITPYTIQRTNQYHDETLNTIASASAIRKKLKQKEDISIAVPYSYQYGFRDLAEKYDMVRHLLITKTLNELSEIFLIDEGMPTLLQNAAKNNDTYDDFLNACTSKRYTHSTIRRSLIHLLLNHKKSEINQLPEVNYLRVLGFNKIGQAHLKKLNILIATNIKQIPEPYRSLELKSAFVYYGNLPKFEIEKPIIIKK